MPSSMIYFCNKKAKQLNKDSLQKEDSCLLPRLFTLEAAAAQPRCLCAVRACFCLAGLVLVQFSDIQFQLFQV